MRDSSDRGEEHPRSRSRSRAAEALVRSVPTVGGDEADMRGGAGAVVVPSADIGDGVAVARCSLEQQQRRFDVGQYPQEDPMRLVSGMDGGVRRGGCIYRGRQSWSWLMGDYIDARGIRTVGEAFAAV